MEAAVRALFHRYEDAMRRAPAGEVDADAVAALYASDVIGAGPTGVRAAKNDGDFRQALVQGHAHYRAIGTQAMRIRDIHLSPIDELHCMAHVGWDADYLRKDGTEVRIAFEVHYLVQVLDGDAKVFGWIAGDERAMLKQHGIG